ncbi:hypothetical protein V6N13_084631 [Hibiscus sabdariffa]
MPPSALDRLASLHIDYPMLFELRNDAAKRAFHCGVIEFITEKGVIYMSYWMMENLLLQEGDTVKVKNAKLESFTLKQGATNFVLNHFGRVSLHKKGVVQRFVKNHSQVSDACEKAFEKPMMRPN